MGEERASGHGRAVVAMAHRGAHGPGVAENTLAAVQRAVALGYTWVETDLRATADGVPVLAHDASLARTTGRDVLVRRLPWAQLAQVSLHGSPALVRLEEALDAAPSLHLNVDVKAASAVLPLVRLLARRPELVARLRVTSFSELRRAAALLALAVRGAPGARRVRSSAGAAGSLACWAVSAPPVPSAVAATGMRALRAVLAVDCLQLPVTSTVRLGSRSRVLRVVTPALLRAAHAAGLQVHVWVVDDPAEMTRLLDAGVDGLVTDQAEALAGVLAERGQWGGR